MSYKDIAIKGNNAEKIELLKKNLLFIQTGFDAEKAAHFIKIVLYDTDEVIQAQNTQLTEAFILISGKARLVVNIPFITKRIRNGRKISTSIRGCEIDEIPEADETYTPEPLSIHGIEEGSLFPNIPNLDNIDVLSIDAAVIDKSRYIDFFTNLDPKDNLTWSKYSVIASSKCIIASIRFSDLASIAPVDFIRELLKNPYVLSFSIAEAQKVYLRKLKLSRNRAATTEL